MNKRILLTLPLAATLALVGCNPSSNDDAGSTGNTGETGETGGGETNPGGGSTTPEPLTVYTDEKWNANTDTFEDLTFFKGGIDLFAVKRTAKLGADEYKTLAGSEVSKGLVTHREVLFDQTSSHHVRTAGFKFQHSAANNSENDILVVTCTPGVWMYTGAPGTGPILIPATLTFSLKSNPSETQELSLTLNGEPTAYKHLVSCDAMDVYDGAGSPDEVVVFIGGKQAYVNSSGSIIRRSAMTRLSMDFDRDGEMEDNDPAVGPMIGGIGGATLYSSGFDDIRALSAVSGTQVIAFHRSGVNNKLYEYDMSSPSPLRTLVTSGTNAFTGQTDDMTVSDMEAHVAFGNIPRVSLVSHDYTGVVTVDYDSVSPSFVKSTNTDAQNCVDVITSDSQPNARLWCHNSTDEGKLLQFTY
ncbi:hypothetical protein [Reinekea blandensis]|uniref:Lipoprotein n=1 Tax=Reinekea blandensis MED297 TaxID=314283 RepID=A4BB37_9GAMM|nr:hypothetical protein [Reinekea blandensis]EAR10650.1 hypothetical protein MED297_11560 [Reinekea sp. MED297] [Reinekea blandensis MED297]